MSKTLDDLFEHLERMHPTADSTPADSTLVDSAPADSTLADGTLADSASDAGSDFDERITKAQTDLAEMQAWAIEAENKVANMEAMLADIAVRISKVCNRASDVEDSISKAKTSTDIKYIKMIIAFAKDDMFEIDSTLSMEREYFADNDSDRDAPEDRDAHEDLTREFADRVINNSDEYKALMTKVWTRDTASDSPSGVASDADNHSASDSADDYASRAVSEHVDDSASESASNAECRYMPIVASLDDMCPPYIKVAAMRNQNIIGASIISRLLYAMMWIICIMILADTYYDLITRVIMCVCFALGYMYIAVAAEELMIHELQTSINVDGVKYHVSHNGRLGGIELCRE